MRPRGNDKTSEGPPPLAAAGPSETAGVVGLVALLRANLDVLQENPSAALDFSAKATTARRSGDRRGICAPWDRHR